MNQLKHPRYLLAVQNLQRSLKLHQEELGFHLTFEGQGWGFVERDRCTIMPGEWADSPEARDLPNHNYFAYIEVDGIQELYEEFNKKKVIQRTAIKDQHWGMRELAIETIDGHRIMFREGVNIT